MAANGEAAAPAMPQPHQGPDLVAMHHSIARLSIARLAERRSGVIRGQAAEGRSENSFPATEE